MAKREAAKAAHQKWLEENPEEAAKEEAAAAKNEKAARNEF